MTGECLPPDYGVPCVPDNSDEWKAPESRVYAIVARAHHVSSAYMVMPDLSIAPIAHVGFDVVNTKTGQIRGHFDAGPGDGGYRWAMIRDDIPLNPGEYLRTERESLPILASKTVVRNLTLTEAEVLAENGELASVAKFGTDTEYQTITPFDRPEGGGVMDIQNSNSAAQVFANRVASQATSSYSQAQVFSSDLQQLDVLLPGLFGAQGTIEKVGKSIDYSQDHNPIILDLNNDKRFLTSKHVKFDWDSDGYMETTNWASAADGFLVVDLNQDGLRGAGDGVIDQAAEVELTRLVKGSITDLHALRQFDRKTYDLNGDGVTDAVGGNGDGKLTSADAIWSELRVWQDANQDGCSTSSELKTMGQLGITVIALGYDGTAGTGFSDTSNDRLIDATVERGVASFYMKGAWVKGGVHDMTLRSADTMQRAPGVTFDGTAGDDTIKGRATYDVLNGLNGNDQLFGGAGNDSLIGGHGNDRLMGGSGADSLFGGDGIDTAGYHTATAGVRASLRAPSTNDGDAAGDVYTNVENIEGSNHNDVLVGSAAGNLVRGLNGADFVSGGVGDDTLSGGSGADRFEFKTGYDRDRITDFENGTDQIHIGIVGVTTSAKVMSYARQVGLDVELDFGNGDVLIVDDIKIAALSDEFTFI